MDLTAGRAWQATYIGPQFLTKVSSISPRGLVWYIDELLRISSLTEAEELFLCWSDVTNIMFDEFRPPYFGQGALEWPKHQMVSEQLDAIVRYGYIWMFFAYLRV